jgi:Fe-S-cluster containining protein
MTLNIHDYDEDGFHDEDECELCVELNHSVHCDCRCGNCCEALILEVSLRDAEREPRIKSECGTLKGFTDDVEGYLLNDPGNGYACHFFDRTRRLCTIYDTRPLMCRLFDCDAYEHRDSQDSSQP